MVQFRIVWWMLTICSDVKDWKCNQCNFFSNSVLALSMYRQRRLFWSAVPFNFFCCEGMNRTSLIRFLKLFVGIRMNWYYQNNHLLLITSSSEEVLVSLQLFVNNSQYVADSVDLSVIIGFDKNYSFEHFCPSIYRLFKIFVLGGLKVRICKAGSSMLVLEILPWQRFCVFVQKTTNSTLVRTMKKMVVWEKKYSTYYFGFQYIGCTVHVCIEIFPRALVSHPPPSWCCSSTRPNMAGEPYNTVEGYAVLTHSQSPPQL